VFSHFSQDTSRSTCARPAPTVQARLASTARKLRERAAGVDGFSLLELLTVVLIIGILAVIALPSFAGQKGKATDAQAKELAHTAATAAEAIATDNGEYGKVNPAELNKQEPSIHIAASATEAYVSAAAPAEANRGYTVTAKAVGGDEFTVSRRATGEVTRTCVSPITKKGCAGGEKGSW
jgi:type IV pilus assembly protein PilA